jgi:HAE1 family hydrophobic/amphiphilic exporter-1
LEKEASMLAVKDLAGPMVAGTMTTVAVFAPLFFLSGVTGDFIKNIPYTIIFILLASQIVSVFVIPLLHSTKFKIPFIKTLNKIFKNRVREDKKKNFIKKINFSKIEEKYQKIIIYFLEKKYRQNLMFISVFVFFVATLLLPIFGVIKSEFFPGGDVPFIYSNIELDKGSTKKDMEDYMGKLKEVLISEKFYSSLLFTEGRTSNFEQSGAVYGERYGNVLLNIKDESKSAGLKHLESLREKIEKAGLDKVTTLAPESGPPSGASIEFNILSKNSKDLKQSAILAENILDSIPGVINVKSQLDKNNTGLEILVDKQKAFYHKVSMANVSQKILSITKGVEVLKIKQNKEEIKIYLKIVKSKNEKKMEEVTPDDILNTTVKNALGEDIYISTFSKVVPRSVDSSIFHLDKENSLKITAENKEAFLIVDIISELKKQYKEKNKNGSKLSFGGASAEQRKSFTETAAAFAVGIAIIFGILIFLFNSIKLPLIIESVIPLAFSGVIIGLLISGNSISFPAILGFIALSGIIVNNSIILIHVYEEKRKEITDNKKRVLSEEEISVIVIHGSSERLRPIILTTITTMAGMIPLLFSSAM